MSCKVWDVSKGGAHVVLPNGNHDVPNRILPPFTSSGVGRRNSRIIWHSKNTLGVVFERNDA